MLFRSPGLTENTTYDFYVRAVCGAGDTSNWAGPHTFTTPCLTYTLPFFESFDATTTPVCWQESGATAWDYGGTPGYDASGVTDHTGNGGYLPG